MKSDKGGEAHLQRLEKFGGQLRRLRPFVRFDRVGHLLEAFNASEDLVRVLQVRFAAQQPLSQALQVGHPTQKFLEQTLPQVRVGDESFHDIVSFL